MNGSSDRNDDNSRVINLKALFRLFGVELDEANLKSVNLSALANQPLEEFEINKAAFGDIVDVGSLDLEKLRALKTLASEAVGRQKSLFTGELAANRVAAAFESGIGSVFKNHINTLAKKEGIDQASVDRVWTDTVGILQAQAAAGKLSNPRFDREAIMKYGATMEAIGTISRGIGQQAYFMNQSGNVFAMQAGDTPAIDPKTELGQVIIVFDIFLEVLGSLLLLINLAFPKFNWDKVLQSLQNALRNRRTRGFFNKLLDMIQMLVRLLLDPNADKEEIIRHALNILKFSLGTNQLWEWLKEGFDLGFWDWVKLGAQFVLLSTLDGVSGGIATAGKFALLLATGWDIIEKLDKIDTT